MALQNTKPYNTNIIITLQCDNQSTLAYVCWPYALTPHHRCIPHLTPFVCPPLPPPYSLCRDAAGRSSQEVVAVLNKVSSVLRAERVRGEGYEGGGLHVRVCVGGGGCGYCWSPPLQVRT